MGWHPDCHILSKGRMGGQLREMNMSEEASFAAPEGASAVSAIDVQDDAAVHAWAEKLDVSAAQIRDAVAAVGSNASDVEEHLKGTRSTTNAEQTKKAS